MVIKDSILAGICIAIGTIIYLNVGGPLGATLFAIGLFTILLLKFKLYTGAIGYINSIKALPEMGLIILGNFIGCFLIMVFFPHPTALNIVLNKLSSPLYLVFVKAFLCGILIYVAVEAYKMKQLLITLLAIPSFILLGAEHSIANFCFFISARYISWYSCLFFIIVIIGNAFGSIAFHRLRTIYFTYDIKNGD